MKDIFIYDDGKTVSRITVGGANVIQNVFGSLLLQLYVAALGRGDKAVLDLPGHAAGSVRQ